MIQWRRPGLWFVLALTVILIAGAALWLSGTSSAGDSRSPLPTGRSVPETGASPLLTPSVSPAPAAVPLSWTGAGAILLWTALGFVLALAIAFLFVRRYRCVK